MKKKILEIYKDLKKLFIKYYNILKNKIIKFYRRNLLVIYKDYERDFIKYFRKFKRKVNKIYKKLEYYFIRIKDNLLKQENRKKYLTTTGILILFNVLLINLYISYGYYHTEGVLSLLRGIVGDMYSNQYDYVQLIYLENTDSTGNGNGDYYLVDTIPTLGYIYSGYKCKNGGTLVFNDETKMASVTTDKKEICSVYFDIVGSMDLNVKIMLEESVGSNTYTLGEKIPAFGYKYSHYECTNNGVIEYNSELHSVKLSSSTKEYCNIYFIKERADININLYVEQTYQTEDYIERVSIPSNILYSLNESRSSCKNINNERVDTTITYSDGYIEVGVGEISSCDIYLNRNE